MCLDQILDMIKANMNPFGTINPLFLFNIATGKSVSQKTEEFLLNISKIGEEERNKFILECIEDPTRFNKSIKRQVIHSFATEGGTKNIKVGDGKIILGCFIRDLSGSGTSKRHDRSSVISTNSSDIVIESCRRYNVKNKKIYFKQHT